MHIIIIFLVLLLGLTMSSGEQAVGGALLLLRNGTLVSRPLGGVGSEWSYPLGPPLFKERVVKPPTTGTHPFTLEGAQLLWPATSPLAGSGPMRVSLDELAVHNPNLPISGTLSTTDMSLRVFTIDLASGLAGSSTHEQSVTVYRFTTNLLYTAPTSGQWELDVSRVFCVDEDEAAAVAHVCPLHATHLDQPAVAACWRALMLRPGGGAGLKAFLSPTPDATTSNVGILRSGALVGEVSVDYPSVDSVFLFKDGTVYALDSHSHEESGRDCTEGGVDGCTMVSGPNLDVATSDSRRVRLSYVLESVSPLIDQMSPAELGDFVKWGRRYVQEGEIGLPPTIQIPVVQALPAPHPTIVLPSEIRELVAPATPSGSMRLYIYLFMPVVVLLAFWLGLDMRKSFQDGWEAGFGAGEQRRQPSTLLPDSDGMDTRSNSSEHPPPEESEDAELVTLHHEGSRRTSHSLESDTTSDDDSSSDESSSSSSSSASPSTVVMSRAASFVNSMLPSIEMLSGAAGGQPALFFQHYTVEKRIGSGVRGAVFCAKQHVTGKLFGIKVVVLTSDREQRAIDEARLHSTLDNSHIVRYFNCWVEELPLHQVTAMRMLPDVDSLLGSSVYGDETDDSQSVASYGHFPTTNEQLHFSTWSDDGSSPTSAGAPTFHASSPIRREPSTASDLTPNSARPRVMRLLFMQMEYFEAGTLRDYLTYRAEASLLPSVAGEVAAEKAYYRHRNLSIWLDIAQGLSYLKERSVIHRDIKPSNIFVSNEGLLASRHLGVGDVGSTLFARMSKHELRRFFYVNRPPSFKIGDFGAAIDTVTHPAYNGQKSVWYQSAESIPSDRNVAMANGNTTCFGTAPYASPDQVSGKLVGFGSDVYSLGIIGIELLHEPFTTDHERLVVLQAAAAGDLPSSMRQEAPEECELISKMLSNQEYKRPQLLAVVKRLKAILDLDELKEAEKAVQEQVMRQPPVGGVKRPIRVITSTPTTPPQ